MTPKPLQILLADDDRNDRLFFKMALDSLTIPTQLVAFADGEKLMEHLAENAQKLPDVLFLDLNMPRKNGFECLAEIKSNPVLNGLPVIIFSTSFELEVVNLLFKNGAQYFMRKPPEFSQLKRIIQQTVAMITEGDCWQPGRDGFVLTVQSEVVV